MSNGHVCCLTGVCCPPGSAEQLAAATEMVAKRHPDKGPAWHHRAAVRFLQKYDYFQGAAAVIADTPEADA